MSTTAERTPQQTTSYVKGIGVGIVVALVLGLIGAALFAWVTTTTGWFIGFVGVLPLLAAGLGMGASVGDRGGLLSGLLAAVIGLAMLGMGYVLIESWLPPFYFYDYGALDVVTALIGGYLAFVMGTGTSE